jgi:hypothetical protein
MLLTQPGNIGKNSTHKYYYAEYNKSSFDLNNQKITKSGYNEYGKYGSTQKKTTVFSKGKKIVI